MTQEKKHDIALMRYSVISPIITGLSQDYDSLDAFYRDASKGQSHQTAPSNTFQQPPSNDGTATTRTAVLMLSYHRDALMRANPEN